MSALEDARALDTWARGYGAQHARYGVLWTVLRGGYLRIRLWLLERLATAIETSIFFLMHRRAWYVAPSLRTDWLAPDPRLHCALQVDGRTSQSVVAQLIARLHEEDPLGTSGELEVIKNVGLTSYEGALIGSVNFIRRADATARRRGSGYCRFSSVDRAPKILDTRFELRHRHTPRFRRSS